MSSAIVYAAFVDGDLLELASIDNPYLGAMHVWHTLGRKYLSKGGLNLFGDLQALWNLAYDPRLTVAERLVHVSTFDHAFVRRENMIELADALATFEPSTANLRQQAELIRIAWENGARLVAWVQTTVAVDLCWEPDSVNEDDPDRPFNIDRDNLNGPEVGVGRRGGRLVDEET